MRQPSEHVTGTPDRLREAIPTSGSAAVGLVAIAGSLVFATIVIRLGTERIAFGGPGALLSQPLAFLGLPVVLVVGWIVLGAALLEERPLAVPIGAGAFLGAAAIDLALLSPVTTWPVPAVDPATFLLLGIQAAAFGYPGGVTWGLTPVLGTGVSTIFGGYLAVRAYRSSG